MDANLVLLTIALVLSSLSFLFSSVSVVWLLAQKLSTHRVEYLPRPEYDAMRQAFDQPHSDTDEQPAEPLTDWREDMEKLFGTGKRDAVNSADIQF